MPFALRARSSREPTIVVKELVSACLKAAGYQVNETQNKLPQIKVELKSFWSDGYQHNRMWMVMAMKLQKGNNSKPIWKDEIEANVGVTWSVGYGKFDQGFTEMLEDTKEQLLSLFRSSKFRSSYNSLNNR